MSNAILVNREVTLTRKVGTYWNILVTFYNQMNQYV